MDEESPKNGEDTNVRVAVRCRPFNTKERNNNEVSCVKIFDDHLIMTNPAGNGEEHSFAFDLIFDQNSRQESLWQSIGVPILGKAFAGYNGTIFAYGQTGSGKTWSMQGGGEGNEGIIPRMNNALFDRIAAEKAGRPTVLFLVTVSYFEIYNEVIFDLLDASDRSKTLGGGKSKQKAGGLSGGGLEIKEHPVLGVYVKGLQEIVVDNAAKLQSIIDEGMSNRTVASTAMNADSSRSHSVFVITLHQKDTEDESKNVFAKVNLVDLAGSERVKSTGASGQTLKEGANINKSLSELGNVINALVEQAKGKRAFVPYRNSKLTRVLQESLGGNSITAMLAALSPAACNFEETLSTLKYANRAKAIKVNAVKNEESSQISKLNEEIRLLKEKLLGQNNTASTTSLAPAADTSVLEEKHRQQLREMEEALKLTWDDKAKVSSQHEEEKRRLEREQKKAARMLEVAREKNWKMLEEKADLDLLLLQLKDLSPQRKHAQVYTLLSTWQHTLAECLKLEQRVSEQFTVVTVYKQALEKDIQQVLQTIPSSGQLVDKSAASMWKQLKDKLSLAKVEIERWLSLQNDVYMCAGNFLREVTHAFISVSQLLKSGMQQANAQLSPREQPQPETVDGTASTENPHAHSFTPLEVSEILRGFKLVRTLVKNKFKHVDSQVTHTRTHILGLENTGAHIVNYAHAVMELLSQADTQKHQVTQSSKASAPILDSKQLKERETLISQMNDCVSAINTWTNNYRSICAIDGTLQSAASQTPSTQSQGPQSVAILPPSMFSLERSYGSTIQHMHASNNSNSTDSGTHVSVDSSHCWVGTSSAQPTMEQYIELSFTERQSGVVSVVVQGGTVTTVTNTTSEPAAPSPSAIAPQIQPNNNLREIVPHVTLPCGLTLSSVTGEVEQTIASLGDLIDWSVMLKKNAPDKFLKRPPVRFIFDLVKFVGEAVPGFLPESILTSDWDTVQASKQSKSDYMDLVIQCVTSYLPDGTVPATNSGSIISGTETQQTNLLLQQLAVCAYAFQRNARQSQQTASASSTQSNATQLQTVTHTHTWPTQIRVCVSKDGEDLVYHSGSNGDRVLTGLTNSQDVFECNIESLLANSSLRSPRPTNHSEASNTAAIKYLRIIPSAWASEQGSGANIPPAMRVSVKCFASQAQQMDAADTQGVPAIDLSTQRSSPTNAESTTADDTRAHTQLSLTSALECLLTVSHTLTRCLEFMFALEETARLRKQEETRKQMQGLAEEKIHLERLMALEKQALTNEKQDLSDQLATARTQLTELTHLYSHEQAHKQQLAIELQHVSEEKEKMTTQLSSTQNELSAVSSELLRLQALCEKQRRMIESLTNTQQEQEAIVEGLKAEVEELGNLKQQWENEKEEFTNQVTVLTEERDTSRANEENLYTQLADTTADLERLQESYVDMTDRYNDCLDDISDLREQLQSYKDNYVQHEKDSFLSGNNSRNNANNSRQQDNSTSGTPGTKSKSGVSGSNGNGSTPSTKGTLQQPQQVTTQAQAKPVSNSNSSGSKGESKQDRQQQAAQAKTAATTMPPPPTSTLPAILSPTTKSPQGSQSPSLDTNPAGEALRGTLASAVGGAGEYDEDFEDYEDEFYDDE